MPGIDHDLPGQRAAGAADLDATAPAGAERGAARQRQVARRLQRAGDFQHAGPGDGGRVGESGRSAQHPGCAEIDLDHLEAAELVGAADEAGQQAGGEFQRVAAAAALYDAVDHGAGNSCSRLPALPKWIAPRLPPDMVPWLVMAVPRLPVT